MFAESSTLVLKRNGRKKLFEMAREQVTPMLQGQEGFEKCFIMVSLETNEATLLTVWNQPRQMNMRIAMFEVLAVLSPLLDEQSSIREFRISDALLNELEDLTPALFAAKAKSNVKTYYVSGRNLERVRHLGDPGTSAGPS